MMSVSLSQSVADAALAAVKDTFDGGFIRIFSGVRPDEPSGAESGTLLGVVTLRGQPGAGLEFVVQNGNLIKPYTPWVFVGLTDGDASWFRLVAPGDSAGLDYEAPRLDGDIGTDAPTDMVWPSVAVAEGMHYTINDFAYLLF